MGRTSLRVLRHEKKPKRAMVLGANRVLEYSGRNHGGGASAYAAKTRFGVAVLSPAGSSAPQLRVWETDLVFSVQQRPTAATAAATGAQGALAAAVDDALDAKTRRALVVDTFGSKRARLDKKKIEDNRRAAETVVAAGGLGTAVAAASSRDSRVAEAASRLPTDVGGLTAEEAAAEASRRLVLPAFNPSALSPELAFPFEGLLDPSAMAELSRPVNVLLKALRKAKGRVGSDGAGAVAVLDKALEAGSLPVAAVGAFVRERFVALASEAGAGDAASSRRPLEALVLLSLLLGIHKSGRSLRPAKPKPAPAADDAEASSSSSSSSSSAAAAEPPRPAPAVPGRPCPTCLELAPEAVADALLRKFTRTQGARARPVWARPPELQSRLLMHIVVLALWAGRFDLTSVLTLARDLGLPPRKLVMSYFQQAGCRTNVATSAPPHESVAGSAEAAAALEAAALAGPDYRVTLPTPLAFPKPRRKRATKK